jgi:hypothetical protein
VPIGQRRPGGQATYDLKTFLRPAAGIASADWRISALAPAARKGQLP